jgi:hypothetical protein
MLLAKWNSIEGSHSQTSHKKACSIFRIRRWNKISMWNQQWPYAAQAPASSAPLQGCVVFSHIVLCTMFCETLQ